MTILLKSKYSSDVKEVKMGFSWTTLFFGIFVPLIRGDWKWAVITLLLALITGGLSWFVVPFFYNKVYIKELISKGFTPTTMTELNKLADAGLVNSLQYDMIKQKIEN